MIVAEQKNIEEILRSVRGYSDIALVACGTCVAVCMAGGEKEALKLASVIRQAAKSEGRNTRVSVANAIRQCDMEFLDELDELDELDALGPGLSEADCVLSLGCGAGVQFLAEKYPDKVIIPALNTTFIGVNRDLGRWTEMCQGCGNCILEKTGGICPISRCGKSHFNGPCGGSSQGRCEINLNLECAWQLIYDRLKRIGQLDRLMEINETRDWRTARDGGPRSQIRKDMALDEQLLPRGRDDVG